MLRTGASRHECAEARAAGFAERGSGRTYVAGEAFHTKREALVWYGREHAALAGESTLLNARIQYRA